MFHLFKNNVITKVDILIFWSHSNEATLFLRDSTLEEKLNSNTISKTLKGSGRKKWVLYGLYVT